MNLFIPKIFSINKGFFWNIVFHGTRTICWRQPLKKSYHFNIFKAVFHDLYLVLSWMLYSVSAVKILGPFFMSHHLTRLYKEVFITEALHGSEKNCRGNKGDKVFKIRINKICSKQPLKNWNNRKNVKLVCYRISVIFYSRQTDSRWHQWG